MPGICYRYVLGSLHGIFAWLLIFLYYTYYLHCDVVVVHSMLLNELKLLLQKHVRQFVRHFAIGVLLM